MLYKDILGQDYIKSHLQKSATAGRIPHAQLFVGSEGSGTLAMAIAYAQYILCNNTSENNDGNSACNLKFDKLSHPDLHFIYPVATNSDVKKHATSESFVQEWRRFVQENVYGSLFDWFRFIDIEKKQAIIGTDEATEINKLLALKSYEGGYKIVIIWHADKMNISASNKLLKLIEEPPNRTVFILITEHIDDIIGTIKSRCQVIDFMALSEQTIAKGLIEKVSCDEKTALTIAHQSEGNFNKALHLFNKNENEYPFEQWFIEWVRSAFKAKGNAAAISDLIKWSENLASLGKEVQKQFLHFCIHFFRQALLENYETKDLVYFEPTTANFELRKFAPFVNSSNIISIFKELEDAIYHIERNGNSKIIFTDLSIKLTRLIHKKD